jgi:ATP adenylyltransferase
MAKAKKIGSSKRSSDKAKPASGKSAGGNTKNGSKTAGKSGPLHSTSAKNAGGKTGVFLQAGKEIWPLERDVLFRPDRFKYVRKLIHPEGCVFCTAGKAKPGFDTLCVFKSQHSMILLNKFPYNSGHLLVIPQTHEGDLLKLSEVEFKDLHVTLRLAVEALQQVYQPGGMNVGLNLGAVAGAGIPAHLHYHVIPRWAGDLNFFPLVAETKTVIESLEMTFDRLIAYFKI